MNPSPTDVRFGVIIRGKLEDEIVHVRRIDHWPPNGPRSARTHMLAVIARGQEGTTAVPHPAGTEFEPLGFMPVEP